MAYLKQENSNVIIVDEFETPVSGDAAYAGKPPSDGNGGICGDRNATKRVY